MVAFEPVRAVLRGLEILRLVNEKGPSTATELARHAALPQPTVIRLLETLIAGGYVHRIEDTNLFGVTARTLALSAGFDADSRLVQLARPLIEGLRTEIGWPVNLATYVGADLAMTVAYANDKSHGMAIPGRLGARLPLLVTSVGIAFLANRQEDERAAILEQLRNSQSDWDTNPDYRSKLDARIAAAQAEGHAFSDPRYLEAIYDSTIWAVAVPVAVHGHVTSAIAAMVLRSAGQQRRILQQILPALKRTAADIGSRLAEDSGGSEAQGRGKPSFAG